MLKEIKATIFTTMYINIKSLRMNFMQYFMLVIIFPLTFFVINIVSSNSYNIIYSCTGMFISMLLSLYINMQATLVASSNNCTTIEMYSVFCIKPFYVYLGQSIFHAIMAIPIFIIMVSVLSGEIRTFSIIRLGLWIFVSFLFLSMLSIFVGGLIKNPNMALPVISMLYMIIVMISPIYNQVDQMNNTIKLMYSVNPITHLISLLYWGLGIEVIQSPYISFIVLSVITVICYVFNYRRWRSAKAVEKLTVFR